MRWSSCIIYTIFWVQSSISISLIMVILNKPQNNPQNKIYPCNSYSISWTTTNDCTVQVRKISFALMKEYCAISPYFRYNYILILYIDIYCVFRRHIRAIKPNIPSSMRINQTLKTKILHIFTLLSSSMLKHYGNSEMKTIKHCIIIRGKLHVVLPYVL